VCQLLEALEPRSLLVAAHVVSPPSGGPSRPAR
jgi:hypothetical protein